MVHPVRLLIPVAAAVMTFAVAPASPARADEAAYLQQLQPKYVFLSAQQLLDAGHKVCAAVGNTGSGMISADTVNMIQKDMAVSVAVANDIVATAVVVLPC